MTRHDEPAPGEPLGLYEKVVTKRLVLAVPAPADLDELFTLYADPEVWAADPLARHTDPGQTARMLDNWRRSWERTGLGIWVARDRQPDGEPGLVGIGGCFIRLGVAWNLGFRLMPGYWGRGLAQEICAAAIGNARRLRPELAVTAYLLEGNDRSHRSTEAAGLSLVWRGPDAGNPDPDAVRLLFADRALAEPELATLTSE
jgi:RimJ/RimL family protein N-acetyltransferase